MDSKYWYCNNRLGSCNGNVRILLNEKFIKKLHDPNYVIITPVVLLYSYGLFVFISDLLR